LDADNGFGVLQSLKQPGVFTTKLAEIGVRGLDDRGLGAAPQRLERLERTGLPLAAPLSQGGRVEALATQDGGDPAGIGGAVGLLQDAQLGCRGERPALRPWREFGRRGRRRRDGLWLAAFSDANSVRQIDRAIVVGHNHDAGLLCPSLNSQRAGVSSSLAQRDLR